MGAGLHPKAELVKVQRMSRLVTIFGGSGFVGRYVASRMAQAGWRVRVAVRRPDEAIFVKPRGTPGQVEPVLCNIRDENSVRHAAQGAEAVVNCVGTFDASGRNSFKSVQHAGAGRIARVSAEEGVSRVVHVSSIGADPSAESGYASSKGLGEAEVNGAFPGSVILRPSVIFGPEDQFFNRFAAMARLSPILPLVGAETKFQPVYVDDVAAAVAKGVLGEADAGTYELGGPDVNSFRELMEGMLKVIRRRSLIVPLPFWAGRAIARASGLASFLTLGVLKQPITLDQAIELKRDNVVAADARTLADLGVHPTSMHAVLPTYLWPYRPDGQYSDITRSARNLRG